MNGKKQPKPDSAAVLKLIARYEEGGSYPKPRSWANCDELGSPYQFFPRYGVSNSSQLSQLLGFGYDPRSSYLAIKFEIRVCDTLQTFQGLPHLQLETFWIGHLLICAVPAVVAVAQQKLPAASVPACQRASVPVCRGVPVCPCASVPGACRAAPDRWIELITLRRAC